MILVLRDTITTVIDDEDWSLVEEYKWLPSDAGQGRLYARAYRFNRAFVMHRLITGALPGQIVDHINRDTLDNRRNNLRIVTTSQNGANSKHRKRISGFRGVYPAPHGLPWAVFIQKQYIGKFQNKEDAARAFDLEAIKRFGECAVLNFEDSK